jgi:hypothetical protein
VVRSNHLTQPPARLRAGLLSRRVTYLSPACTWLGLGVGLLPIGIVTPLLGSSLLHPGGGPLGNLLDLLDLPAGSQRNGLCLRVGERRLRFPTHGTWLRHLEQLLNFALFLVPDGPAHPCFRLTWVGLVGCAVQEQGVFNIWGGGKSIQESALTGMF